MATGPRTIRVARTAPATLDHTFIVGETPTDPTGPTATVAITAADGTSVSSGSATHDTTGRFTYALAGQSALGRLAAAWTATFTGSAVVETDYVEVVGARYFTLADARASDRSLSSPEKYPLADLERARQEVEDEVEAICDRAFVPSYRRAVLDGTGTTEIVLTDAPWAEEGRSAADIRRIVTATQASQFGATPVALTSQQLAACYVTATNSLRRTDGGIWTAGYGNIVIEYEYGLNAPPADLVRAMYVRFRDVLNVDKTGIPDRATGYTTPDGGSYRLSQPGRYETGLAAVDAVYGRYSRRAGDDNGTGSSSNAVASRVLTYNVQKTSLFHGRSY